MTESDRKNVSPSVAHCKDKSGRTSRAETLLNQLASGYTALFEQYPIEDHVALLDATPRGKGYYYLLPEVTAYWHNILDGYGVEGLETYNRVTMLFLISTFQKRTALVDYPDSIVSQFWQNFERIEKKIAESDLGTYEHTSDLLQKDLAICLQRTFPAGGAWIVDEHCGFSRAILLSGGFRQFFKFLYFLLFVVRGNRPFYVTHTHMSLVRGFTSHEREACHARIAEMLESDTEMKGVFASGWLYDPALEKVSPRLAYLRKHPQDNGAWVFRVGEDIDSGALSKSATRRKLFEEGKYVPTAYLVVWPRKKIIDWARRHAR